MKKLLALNRGEIAIRILRAATELGLRTVAVYSQEDRLSLHRFKADEAYLIGEGKGPVQAYLDVEGIVALAAEKGVDAIHPDTDFCRKTPRFPALANSTESPSSDRVSVCSNFWETKQPRGVLLMKRRSQRCRERRPDRRREGCDRRRAEHRIPAHHKGGIRRRRARYARCRGAGGFRSSPTRSARGSGRAFGNEAVFLERYIRRARHIEVQILGDKHGNILHLYERDCSVQRRHQKVVEVAPAVQPRPKIRRELADAAVQLARPAGYYNAGTVEFLVDADTGEWFFIEVNPRVQVEHTVTEMVTGVDVVRSQILIAQGHELHGPPCGLPEQDDVPLHGFALQCRVTTEDPRTLRARLRQAFRPIARPRLRHPPGWRIGVWRRGHHPVLRFPAGEGNGVGKYFPKPASAWIGPFASSAFAA